jgi:predicted extracellular nuclease/sugar lactone lactonase YvrE
MDTLLFSAICQAKDGIFETSVFANKSSQGLYPMHTIYPLSFFYLGLRSVAAKIANTSVVAAGSKKARLFGSFFSSPLLSSVIIFMLLSCALTVNAQTISTIAGNGTQGGDGDNGPALSASFYYPNGLAVDSSGNIYVADEGNNRVRKISTTGIVTTFAGSNSAGFGGDGGPATSAYLNSPHGLTFDASGNLYIADRNNHRIRKVTPAGIITTVAGSGSGVAGLGGYDGDGGPATSALLRFPRDVAINANGVMFIADTSNRAIRKVSNNGEIQTIAGIVGVAPGFNGDDQPASSALLDFPVSLALDPSGNLYIADSNRIRKIDNSGMIRAVAQANNPPVVRVDPSGLLWISDEASIVLRIGPDGIVSIVAGQGGTGFSGDGNNPLLAKLYLPHGIAFSATGKVYIADYFNQRIRLITPGLPGAPGIGNARAGNSEAFVSFTPPANDGGTSITGYTVSSSPAGGVDTQAGTNSLEHLITGLNNGTAYTFTVQGTNVAGSGTASAASNSVTPRAVPGAPIIGSAAAGNTQAVVTFSPPSNIGGSPITGYTVTSFPAGGVDSQAGGLGFGHIITGLTNGVSYRFSVTATNSAGQGFASTLSNAIIPASASSAPIIGSAVAGNAQASVSFSAPLNNGGLPINGYVVTSSPAGGVDSQSGSVALSHVVSGLVNGTAYTFNVTAINDVGNSPSSAASNSVTPATTPSAAAAPSASATSGQAAVVFSAPANNGGSAITGYNVFSSPTGGIDSQAGTLSTSRTITGLANGTNYTFKVQAINALGAGALSASSNSVVPKSVPGAPSISAIAPGNRQVSIVITPPSQDGGSPITSYTIVTSPAAGTDSSAGTTNFSRVITGLNNGTNYTFTARATNANGNSPASAAAFATPSSSAPVVISINDAQVIEGDSGTRSLVFTVSLNKTSSSAVVFDFWTTEATAKGGSDFINANSTGLSIPAGSLSTTISVSTYGDKTYEKNETLLVNLGNVSGAAILDGTATGTILNDEPVINRIETFAGIGTQGFSGDGGPARSAGIFFPRNIALSSNGTVYFSDSGNNRIRKVSPDGVISTYAGSSSGGFSGDGGSAVSAMLLNPTCLFLESTGDLYFCDTGNSRIRKISALGIITTVAGNGLNSSNGDGGLATAASFAVPSGLVRDSTGRMYISETGAGRVRVIGSDGIVNAFAGINTGTCTVPVGDNGPALLAYICSPLGIALDKLGNLYIADSGHNLIRRVDKQGIITTVAGDGNVSFSGDDVLATATSLWSPQGIAFDSDGSLYISEFNNKRVRKIATNGIITTVAGDGTQGFSGDGGDARVAGFNSPSGVALDSAGNLYISDVNDQRIRKVTAVVPTAPQSLVAFAGNRLATVTITAPAHSGESPITGYTVRSIPAGGIDANAGSLALTRTITGLANGVQYSFVATAMNASGVSNDSNLSNTVVPFDPALGTLSISDVTLAEGNSGTSIARFVLKLSQPAATNVSFNLVTQDATALAGSDYIAGSVTGMIIPTGQTSVNFDVIVNGDLTAESHETFTVQVSSVVGANIFDFEGLGQILNDEAYIATVDYVAGIHPSGFTGDGSAARFASLNRPEGIESDGKGNIFIADTGNYRIRVISPDGIIQTVTGRTSGPSDSAGFEGSPATYAFIYLPEAVTSDAQGNIYFTEYLGGNRIRKITADGTISTLAGSSNGTATNILNGPSGIAVDKLGNVFYSDELNQSVRKIAPNGSLSLVAGNGTFGFSGDGGPAINAQMRAPKGIAFDPAGNLYIADPSDYRIRKLNPQGVISTFAGTGVQGFSGDDGLAVNAMMSFVCDVAADNDGNIFFTDTGNNRIRRVDAVGIIKTIAGNGVAGSNGDGGIAANANFYGPCGITFDGKDLFVTEREGNRVRKINLGYPSAPVNVTAGPGNAQAQINFTAPADNGGSLITGYTVRSYPAGGIDSAAGSTSLSRTITGLTNGVSYTFKVVAINTNGTSAESAPSNSVVPNTAAIPVISISNASVIEGNSGVALMTFQISLFGTAPVGGTRFDVATKDVRSNGKSAVAGKDYAPINITGLQIAQGANSAIVSVKVIADKLIEPDEVFALTISNPVGATIDKNSAMGLIINDDSASLASLPKPENSDTSTNHDTDILAIHDIQGSGLISDFIGKVVITEGIVTALRSDGFFLQTSDVEQDGDIATSEGIYIYTISKPPVSVAVGSRVRVTGPVQERVSGSSSTQLSLTQIMMTEISVLGKTQVIPKPVKLNASILNSGSPIASLERIEGMRIAIPNLSVVDPVGGTINQTKGSVTIDGKFYGVLAGISRPFQGPGIHVLDPRKISLRTSVFDGNPERIMVDSAGQVGAKPIAVDVGDIVKGLIGVLDYADASYRLSPDPAKQIAVVSAAAPRAARVPNSTDITIGDFNLRRLFNDVNDPGLDEPVATNSNYILRLAKTSNAICSYANNPDILGVAGVENISALSDLASAINSRAGEILFPGSCKTDPHYRAYLIEGNARDGTDIGFLLSTAEVRPGVPRIEVLAVQQVAKTALFSHPDGQKEALYNQPPLVLKVRVNKRSGESTELTILLAEWMAMDGLDSAEPGNNGWTTGSNFIRAKRRAQALEMAKLIQSRQQLYPKERTVVIGGFNVSEFNDGYDDLMGLVTGRQTQNSLLINPSSSPLTRPLTNMTLRMPAGARYSAISEGNALATDHILINQALVESGYSLDIDYARINADFGEDNAGDSNVPMRVSNRDPVILYLSTPTLLPAKQCTPEGIKRCARNK